SESSTDGVSRFEPVNGYVGPEPTAIVGNSAISRIESGGYEALRWLSGSRGPSYDRRLRL
ncbi:MAG: hypothetical protein ACK2UO_11125, partial [Caldilineaceae bacterium]